MLIEKLPEITNSSISVFHPLENNCLYSDKFKNIQFMSTQIQLAQLIMNGYLVISISQILKIFKLTYKF
jgi:hypothetical protein